MPDALPCIAWLVKISNEFDHISGGYVQRTTRKQPTMVLSAGTKTFEIWKLGNYPSHVNETYVTCTTSPQACNIASKKNLSSALNKKHASGKLLSFWV